MEELKALIEQLKSAGITPQVDIITPVEGANIEEIKALRQRLQESGIASEVHIAIQPGKEPSPGPEPEVSDQESFAIVVTGDKMLCMMFKRTDKAGKPIMEIREPRIKLLRGERLRVSSVHKVSDKDKGDGVVVGTGGDRFYLIVDCPGHPEAIGLYASEGDVSPA